MTAGSPAEEPLVLIVDDSGQNRKLARDVLQAAAFRTLEAASGGEAIALATEHLPDVILMDLHLPDMDGTDAARKLGDRTATAQIPIVALSSSPASAREGFLGAGFAGHLEKPINVRDFPDQVRGYCCRGC